MGSGSSAMVVVVIDWRQMEHVRRCLEKVASRIGSFLKVFFCSNASPVLRLSGGAFPGRENHSKIEGAAESNLSKSAAR